MAGEGSRRLARRPVFVVAVAVAVVSGVVSGAAYLWVHTIGVATMYEAFGAPWTGYPVGPGIAVFILAMPVLLVSLVVARVLVRPHVGGNLLWVAGWLAWVACALNFSAWADDLTESFGGWASPVWLLSVVLGPLAAMVAISGLITSAIGWRRRGRVATRTATTSRVR